MWDPAKQLVQTLQNHRVWDCYIGSQRCWVRDGGECESGCLFTTQLDCTGGLLQTLFSALKKVLVHKLI
jgi:hypothetical protein